MNNRAGRAGGTGWAALGEPGWPGKLTLFFKISNKKPSR